MSETATDIKGVTASSKVVLIALNKLTAGKNHSRLYKPTEEEWKNIANQLRPAIKAGTIDPVHVSAPNDKGKFTVTAGLQRWQIAKELGVESLPCLLTDLEPDSNEAILDNFAENIHRQDLSFVERAAAMQKYAELKGIDPWITSKEIARFFRVEVPTLALSKQILDKCSPKVMEGLHRDEISVKAARVLAGFPEEVQDKLTEKAKQVQEEENEEISEGKEKVKKAKGSNAKKAVQKTLPKNAKTSAKVTPKYIAKAAEEDEELEPEVKEKVKKAVTGAKKTTESKVQAAQDTLDMTYQWGDDMAASKNPFVAKIGELVTKVIDRKLTPKAAAKELEVLLVQEDVAAA